MLELPWSGALKNFGGGLFELSAVYWGLVETWMLFRQLGSVERSQDRNSGVLLLALVGGGIYAASRIARMTSFLLPGSVSLHLLMGGLVILFGTSFRVWSIITLGRFFRSTVTIQAGHEVVTKGPYRHLRHPSYSGLLLNALGVGVGLGNWLGVLVLMPLAFVGIYQRIRVEEQVLSSALGEPYRVYMQHTKRLLPFLY